jgi:hypothetical protein
MTGPCRGAGGAVSLTVQADIQPRTIGAADMVERRSELNRRYHRHKKMAKLKARLAAAKDQRERDTILKKIHKLSPWWQEPARA